MVSDEELVRILRQNREPQPTYLHKVDTCQAAPAELVCGREHGPGGGRTTWYFCCPANCHGSAQRRMRQVSGGPEGGGVLYWHQDCGKKAILGPDKKPMGAYKRTLYYVLKTKDPSGAGFKKKRLGWCMVEIWLEHKDDPEGADQQEKLVLCKMYMSPRNTDPETSTAAAIKKGCDGATASAEAPTVEWGTEEVGPKDQAGVEAAPIEMGREEVALEDPAGAEAAAAPIEMGREEVALEAAPFGHGCEAALLEEHASSAWPPELSTSTPTESALLPALSTRYGVASKTVAHLSRLPSHILGQTDAAAALEKWKAVAEEAEGEVRDREKPTVVVKVGGSSIPSAEGIKMLANLVCSSTEESRPVVVISAMKTTTTNVLLAAEKALSVDAQMVSDIDELKAIKDLHRRMVDDLGLDGSTVSVVWGLLGNLEELLKNVARTKELTSTTRCYLASFVGRLSAKIFSAYLNKLGRKTRQYDALDVGLVTTDKYMDIPETCSAIAKRLQGDWAADLVLVTPIVVGFLGKGWKTCSGTTFGRGSSELAAATIGRALGSIEIQIWKDVDDVLTCDPNICANAKAIPYLTFDEAIELRYFDEQTIRPAREGGIPVRVRNSYNHHTPGTLITETRDMSQSTLTGIKLESNMTVLDIESTRKLGQDGFQANVLSVLKVFGVSMDYVTIIGGNISLALDPSKMLSNKLNQPDMYVLSEADDALKFPLAYGIDDVVGCLQGIAVVRILPHRSIVTMIGNEERTSHILAMAFQALLGIGVKTKMIFQGLPDSMVMKLPLVVNDSEAPGIVGALHSAFFENVPMSEVGGVPENSAAAASGSGVRKRRADEGHPEAPAGARQQRRNTEPSGGREETEAQLSPDNSPSTVGDLPEYFNSIVGDNIPPVNVDYDLYPPPQDIAEMARGLFLDGAAPSEQSVEAILAEISPDVLLGSASGSTSCPPPALY